VSEKPTEALLLALLMYGKHPMSPNSPGWVSFTVPADFISEAEQTLAVSLAEAGIKEKP